MKFITVKKLFTISFLIKILFVGFVASGGYVAYSIFYAEESYLAGKDLAAPAGEDPYRFVNIERKDYTSFLRQLSGREIFSFPRREEDAVPAVDPEKVRRLIDNLKLVGIKSGASPRVIIENRQQSRSFYLKEGDTFLEDIKVEAIGKDSVTLNCYGESFELYL